MEWNGEGKVINMRNKKRCDWINYVLVCSPCGLATVWKSVYLAYEFYIKTITHVLIHKIGLGLTSIVSCEFCMHKYMIVGKLFHGWSLHA